MNNQSYGLDITNKSDLVGICYTMWFNAVLGSGDTPVTHANNVTELTEHYENEIATLKAEHERIVTELTEKYETEIADLKTQHEEAIAALNQAHEEAIEALTADYEGRIQEMLDTHAAEMAAARELHRADVERLNGEIGTLNSTVSRLETLKAEKASLTAMLEGFTDYSDINAMLRVQERLYDVIEEIESLQTKLNIYDGQVAMSTVKLSLREVITYPEVVEPDPPFGQRMKEAFVESWTDFAEGWQDFAVGFVEAFPTLLVVVGIHAGIFFIIYGSIKRGQKKRAARDAALAAARAARENAVNK